MWNFEQIVFLYYADIVMFFLRLSRYAFFRDLLCGCRGYPTENNSGIRVEQYTG